MSAVMQCELLSPDSPKWAECLADASHDFYHLPHYFKLCGEFEGGEPQAFLAEEGDCRYFAPMLVQSCSMLGMRGDCGLNAITPYGYPTPLVISRDGAGAEEGFIDRAIAAHITAMRRRGISDAFFRLHPLLPLSARILRKYGCLVGHGQTVFIDLTQSDEELWRQTRAGHRSEINRSKKNGYVAAMDHQWKDLDGFCEAYLETMQRVDAAGRYFFPRRYFLGLKELCGGVFHLCTVHIGGDLACTGLFSECSGIVQYHLSGTRDKYVKQYPTKIMLEFVRNWAKQRGNRVFHLGGGLGAGEDSLFLFKAGFSHLRADFHTWRVVVDQRAYADKVQWWETRAKRQADPLDGYFPAYRKEFPSETRSASNAWSTQGELINGSSGMGSHTAIAGASAG